eukprot:COSAG02_NODE_11623_length_1687_cov_20.032746_3_plen_31_part_01
MIVMLLPVVVDLIFESIPAACGLSCFDRNRI